MNNDDLDTTEVGVDALTSVLSIFKNLSPSGRETLLQTVATFYRIETLGAPSGVRTMEQIAPNYSTSEIGAFSEDRTISPKEFMMQKQPRTDVERVACLGYYLTHYRDTPHFKTQDISKLNTDAAQPKFSNAAHAVDNATKQGYLVPATKGNKQLSAAGEQFVQALPDRAAAKAVLDTARPRRRTRKSIQKKATDNNND